MTDDTENNNVKQFTLNLVSPSDNKDKDEELKGCLDQGIEVFLEQVKREEVTSFFIILLDDTDGCTFIGAGQSQLLKTLGALRSAEDELLSQGL